jgi:hypothetical protein
MAICTCRTNPRQTLSFTGRRRKTSAKIYQSLETGYFSEPNMFHLCFNVSAKALPIVVLQRFLLEITGLVCRPLTVWRDKIRDSRLFGLFGTILAY